MGILPCRSSRGRRRSIQTWACAALTATFTVRRTGYDWMPCWMTTSCHARAVGRSPIVSARRRTPSSRPAASIRRLNRRSTVLNIAVLTGCVPTARMGLPVWWHCRWSHSTCIVLVWSCAGRRRRGCGARNGAALPDGTCYHLGFLPCQGAGTGTYVRITKTPLSGSLLTLKTPQKTGRLTSTRHSRPQLRQCCRSQRLENQGFAADTN